MAKLELFQAVLNKMLNDIREDACDAFSKPPISGVIDDIPSEEIEKYALDFHKKGETGIYLYFIALLELRKIQTQIEKPE
jgi:hypothetical protein